MKKVTLLVTLVTLLALPLSAQVDFTIESGIAVETSSGISVEIDGDLTESGTGYFKGEISSGARTGMTTFAGLTLSTGVTGTITRTTGSAYAGGNGEGTNLKRYYEISNTGGNPVTADMTAAYVSSGANEELDGLAGPYFIYSYVSSWTGYGDGSVTSPISASSVEIPTGSSSWVFSEGVRLAVKIYLQGSYITADDSMSTTLCPDHDNVIPITSPYSEDARTTTIPSCVTDWLLVELRSAEDGAAVGYRSCFLRSNGMLVADDLITAYIGIPVPPGDYWVVIRHRNHLAVETKTVRSGLTWGSTPDVYNFTNAATQMKGDDAALLEAGVYGMYAGDADCSGGVGAADQNAAWNNRTLIGYLAADHDLSGTVGASDQNWAWNNRTKLTSVK